jgi:catechol 2,3-dioxygenase
MSTVGVHSLDHFTIQVPDLAEAERFYSAFGLRVIQIQGELHLSTECSNHVYGVVRAGDKKKLISVTFGAFAADMPAFEAQLTEQGVSFSKGEGGALQFSDPVGMQCEIIAAEKSMPNEKADHDPVPYVVGERGTLGKSTAPKVHPRRLAHVLFFTPDIEKSVGFFQSALGLNISDFPGPVAFLHGRHGSDHHLVAFAMSDAVGYHHSSWDVGAFDDLGRGMMQMEREGFGERSWGVGRHTLGSNYFQYIRDPWNSFVEYSFDIDYIPKGTSWQTIEVAPEDTLALWGPEPPSDFITNHEAS